jgi:NAD(P)-dependent dehydrogenase (short-subunit alcohol dehydrogenase family)
MARLCEGRVAIVTGGARGVGREHCLMLAEHGAKVVVNDLGGDRGGTGQDVSAAQQVVNEIKAKGGEAVANGEDVSDWNGAKRMIDQAVETFGKLDAVVLNAGILRDRMLVNMSEQEWDAVIKVHLKGTFAPARHAAAYWRDQTKAKGGPVDARIITTTSVSGIYGNIGQTNYGAAKAGIASFTVIAARELGRYGITVNSISPSAFTRMTEDLREYTEEDKKTRSPRWIAPVATWLASEESREITGRVFQAGNGIFAVAEGWHKGPQAEQIEDPRQAGKILTELAKKARKNAGMLDWHPYGCAGHTPCARAGIAAAGSNGAVCAAFRPAWRRPCREPRLVQEAQAARHRDKLLQRSRGRQGGRLPPDPSLSRRGWHVPRLGWPWLAGRPKEQDHLDADARSPAAPLRDLWPCILLHHR